MLLTHRPNFDYHTFSSLVGDEPERLVRLRVAARTFALEAPGVRADAVHGALHTLARAHVLRHGRHAQHAALRTTASTIPPGAFTVVVIFCDFKI